MSPQHTAEEAFAQEAGPTCASASTMNNRPTRQSDTKRGVEPSPQLNTEQFLSSEVHQELRNVEEELALEWTQTRPHFLPPELPHISTSSILTPYEHQRERVWEEEGDIHWTQTRPDLLPDELPDEGLFPTFIPRQAEDERVCKEEEIPEHSQTIAFPLNSESPEPAIRTRLGPCQTQESCSVAQNQEPVPAQQEPVTVGRFPDSDSGVDLTYEADDEESTSIATEDSRSLCGDIEFDEDWAASRPPDKCSLEPLAGDEDRPFHVSIHVAEDYVNPTTYQFTVPAVRDLLVSRTYDTQVFEPKIDPLWPEEGEGWATTREPFLLGCDKVLVSCPHGPPDTSESGTTDSGLSHSSHESVLKIRIVCTKEKLGALLHEFRKLACVVSVEEIAGSS